MSTYTPPLSLPGALPICMLCGLAVFLLPACIIATPWGLAPFVALIVPAMLLAPDLMRAAWRPSRAMVVPLLLLAAYVAAVALASKRSEEHTSELQSLMGISYAVFCVKKKKMPT